MKKIISLLLVLTLVLTQVACTNKAAKTEEELEAEIRAELENEAEAKEKLKEEIKAEMEAEDEDKNKDEEKSLDKDNTVILEGIITDYRPQDGIGVILDKEKKIYGKDVKRIFFKDNKLLDFIPRKYLTYGLELGTTIKGAHNEKIPVKVRVDADSFEYFEPLWRTTVDLVKVVSLDGESNPADKSEKDFPDDYYKDVINALTEPYFENLSENIKDMDLYENNSDFKTAVDKLYEKGYSIKKGDSSYIINKSEEGKDKSSKGELEGSTNL
ncbi:hypothetical protein [Maledivibacter halophilus]|uniref:Uncharacterized protein n=1 Tax=Maledivibacter halophilus TaxID=36842 RepID=A0A1T5ICD4_9FIRM|nr:hypothetical protein [Maledivibacter halophilus]SKC36787.1 hypothetical protein SAMN02194393_00198 [Maledivibacter halophilus]